MRTYIEHKELYSGLCGDLNGKEIQKNKKKRGDIYIHTHIYTFIYTHITDSFCSTAETNNILKQLYSDKNFLKRRR